jgi:hypothetical protein
MKEGKTMERNGQEQHVSEAQLRAMRKVRGDWGNVRPYTRVEAVKKRYNRKLNRKLEREAYKNY